MKNFDIIRNIRFLVSSIFLLFPILMVGNDLIHEKVQYIPSEHATRVVNNEYISTIIENPIEKPEPFIAIGFNAKIINNSSKITFHLRASEDNEKWGEWLPVEEEINLERANFKYLAELSFFDKKTRFIQFKTYDLPNFEEINFSFISPGKTPRNIIEERIIQSSSSTNFREFERPAMVLRTEWGCPQGEHVNSRSLTDVSHLIIHHSAGNTSSDDFGAIVLAYWDYHVNGNGWADIGYNWLVDPNGVLYKGRAWKSESQENVLGAHNSGMNGNTSGICFIGNYMSSTPSDTGLSKVAGISAFLCDKYEIDPMGESYHPAISRVNDNMDGHGQSGGNTACPGTQLINRLQLIRNQTNAFLQPDSSIMYPPNTPDYVRVLNGNDSTLNIQCESVYQAQEYIAYISTDGVTFTDSVSSSTNNIEVTGLTENMIYYFTVQAANDSGYSSLTRDLYAGIPSATDHTVLVVDGFDRSTNATHDYVKQVANPIKQRGYAFSFALNESIYDGKMSLKDFETVIWILGDESTVDQTFNSIEQDSVEAFLKNGGKLFVSGAEVGWDMGRTAGADKDFYNNYLKAEYIDDAPGGSMGTYYSCEAINNYLFDGISDFNFDDGTHGTINIEYPDAINGINGAQNILRYKTATTANIAGVSFEGLFPGGSTGGKIVYLGLPFEMIYPEASRIEIMAKVFDYFEAPIVSTDENNDLMPVAFKLYQNYPNPFNPVTSLRYDLPEQSFVTIVIYDVVGREIKTLINQIQNPGQKSVLWNATDQPGKSASAGVYFYQVRVGDLVQTRKMLLLK